MAALAGATIKPQITVDPSDTSVIVEVGVVKSLTPSTSTAAVVETGLGGISKKRLSSQEFNFGWEGLITDKAILTAGLDYAATNLPPTLEIQMHAEKLTGARVETMTITGSEGEALGYSFEGKFLASASATVPTVTLANTFFVYSDGAISIAGSTTAVVKSFEVTVSRSMDFVYGTSLAPTSLDIGTTVISGSLEIEAASFAETMTGAIAADAAEFVILLSFTNPITDETMLITLTDCQFNAVDGAVDPESSLTVTKSFDADSIAVAEVT